MKSLQRCFFFLDACYNHWCVCLRCGQSQTANGQATGGVTQEADLDQVNLAFVLSDGQKIYIPSKKEKEANEGKVYITTESGNNVIIKDKVEGGKKQKVNINEAKQEDFEELPGIGPSIAKKIIEYREQNGKFTSIDELQEVKGIGEAKFENIKEYITVK